MRLSPYILDLFFGSDEGARLVQGFEELAAVWTKHDATRGGNVDAPSPAAMAGAGSASDIPQDDRRSSSNDEDDRRELAWEARSAIPDCFDAVAECMRRTLLELGGERPSSREEAAALFERVLDHGLVVLGSDADAAWAFGDWLEEGLVNEESDDADEEEDSSAFDELPSDSGDAADDDDLDDEDGDDAEEPDVELLRLGGADDHGRKVWLESIPAISWALHCFAPEWFVPYAFVRRFHQFEAICEELGIPLPRLPGKASYLERCRYYLQINEALQELRVGMTGRRMSPAELCAFVYGFCVEHVPNDEVEELPPPRRAWFLMASPDGDFEDLDEATHEDRLSWQGGYEVRPGDIW